MLLVGFIGMAVLLPFSFVLSHRLYKQLRTEHQAAWLELGQPSFPGNSGAFVLWRTRKWLRANCGDSGDVRLESLYVRGRKVNRVYICFFALAFIGVVLRLAG